MVIRGRTFLAAITACTILLLFSAESYPSSGTEAGRKYAVARERLVELKKSPKKKKYRTYWIDAARLFESIERKYSGSPQAAEACFDRAGIFLELSKFNRSSKDADEAVKIFTRCNDAYPRHQRSSEAFYHIIMITKNVRKDKTGAVNLYRKMADIYPQSPWTDRARAELGIRFISASDKKRETEIRKQHEPVIAQPTAPNDLGIIKSVRYWSGGAYTRIVIDQDKPLRFKAHELKNPDRLVFDIMDARVAEGVNKDPIPVNDGILRQVRTGQHTSETVRVVLDLSSIKSYVAFPLHEPERLVIDVTGEAAVNERDDSDSVQNDKADQNSGKNDEYLSQNERSQGQGDGQKLSLSRQLGLKIRTIAIDAGHGGHDPGAIGRGGLKEKDITLDIAKRLSVLVKERLGCQVVMTRDRDVFIPLDDRPAIAKTKGSDLFVSIHVNANRKRKARGVETYIQSLRASDREAMATAAFENATSTKTLSQLDTELARILKDLRTDDKQEESLQLAHAIQASLVDTIRPVQGHVVNLGVKRAFFYVLINTDMPSILAEVGFISNPEEERMLKKESYRQKIAEALFQGVKKYVEARGQQVAGL